MPSDGQSRLILSETFRYLKRGNQVGTDVGISWEYGNRTGLPWTRRTVPTPELRDTATRLVEWELPYVLPVALVSPQYDKVPSRALSIPW
jgi:hypothetical protein